MDGVENFQVVLDDATVGWANLFLLLDDAWTPWSFLFNPLGLLGCGSGIKRVCWGRDWQPTRWFMLNGTYWKIAIDLSG